MNNQTEISTIMDQFPLYFDAELKKEIGNVSKIYHAVAGDIIIDLEQKMDQIPFALIGALVSTITAADWIALYEKNVKR